MVIEVTLLNGDMTRLNPMLITFIQAIPDTLITLLNGSRVIVKESIDEILDKVQKTHHYR